MTRLLLLICFVYSFSNVKSSHILGGTSYVEQIGPNKYVLTIKVLRDCLPGTASLGDSILYSRVYEQNTNTLLFNISPQIDTVFLDTTYNKITGRCQEIHIFSDTLTLPNNPNGYYYNWDVCCRSLAISNIDNPTGRGWIWTLDFPDPALTGRNNSPKFSDLLNHVICNGDTNSIDLSCTDADGDSLVYSMHNLFLGTNNSVSTKPFKRMIWKRFFEFPNNLGAGSSITVNSSTGIITALPRQNGYYSVGVKCEEYRNGVKIGVVYQDFVLVVQNCSISSIKEKETLNNIKVYPNPNNGEFTIEIGKDIQIKSAVLTDVKGKLIKNINKENLFQSKINLEGPSGIYFLTLSTESEQKIYKIIKQ